MKFSGLWGIHRVFGFDQTQKSSGNKKQQLTQLNFNCMFSFNIFESSTLLEGQLSPLRILEAEVENSKCSHPMLDDE
jgi:hypothetical protein